MASQKQRLYLEQQIAFLQDAKCEWNSALHTFITQVITEVENWTGSSSTAATTKTFSELLQMTHASIDFITDQTQKIQGVNNESGSPFIKDYKMKRDNFLAFLTDNREIEELKQLQSRVENLENVFSALSVQTKQLASKQKKIVACVRTSRLNYAAQQSILSSKTKQLINKLKHVQEMSTQNKKKTETLASIIEISAAKTASGNEFCKTEEEHIDEYKSADIFNSKCDVDIVELSKSLKDVQIVIKLQESSLSQLQTQINNIESAVSKCKNFLDKNKDDQKIKALQCKVIMACQLFSKKMVTIEKLRNTINQKLELNDCKAHQQKYNQLTNELEVLNRTLSEMKLAQDAQCSRIDEILARPPQMPPPGMFPPPHHPFPHDHHHRRHHHRHC